MADNPYLDLAQEDVSGRLTPGPARENPYLVIAQEDQERENQRLMQNLAQAAKQNPNQAGEAQRISQKTGMPSGLVQTDLDEMKRQAYLQDVQQRRLATTNPILARQLQDPEFAAIAHDQIDHLSGIEGMFKRLSEVPSNISTQFTAGRLQTEQSLLGYDKMAGAFSKDQQQRLNAVTEELRKSYAGDKTWEGNVASLVGQMSYTLPEVWTYAGATALGFGAMGAMVGGPLAEVTGPGAAVAGMAVGGAYKASEMAFKQEAGGAYLDMVNEGINPNTATYAATGVGLINAALEDLSFGFVTAPFRKYAARKIGAEVAESLAKPTMRSALVEFGKKYIEAIASESGTEVLQEISSIAGEEIAKAVDGIKTTIGTPEGQQEMFDRLIEIARKTAEGMSVVGVVGPSFNLKHDYKRAKVAERQAEFFTNLNLAADNEVVKRNPAAYQRFLQVQADGAAVKNVYIDSEQFVNVLNQSKVTREQIDQVIPGISTQIDEAVKTGSDIVIPTGEYGTKVAGTDLGNALLPHVKLTPDAFSMVEAEQFQKEKEQMLSDAAVLLKEKSETEQAFVESAREVKGIIEDQIKATGIYRDDEARTMATMAQAMYVTKAAEMGITPKDLYDKIQNPVVLAGQQQAAPDVELFNQLAAEGIVEGVPIKHQGEGPTNTIKAYKLFRTDPRYPGKLFPLFVNASVPVETGQWVDAEAGPMVGDKVKSKLGALAYRPGWHAADLPIATHIGGKSVSGLTKPDHRPANQVWAEVEIPADVDWQTEASSRAQRSKTGEIIPRTAHITDQVPEGGHYRYKTNPNMTGDWIIGGSMKVNKVLTDEEVKSINDSAGVADLPRMTPAQSVADKLAQALTENGPSPDSPVALPPNPLFYQINPESMQTWEIRTIEWMSKQGFSKKEMDSHIAAMKAQMKIFQALGPVEIEMFPRGAGKNPGRGKGPFRTNSDPIYKITFDASAMCVRRLEAGATAAMVEEKIGRALTASERMALVALFQAAGKTAPCLYRYVESPRGKMAEFAQKAADIVAGKKTVPAKWSDTSRQAAAEALEEAKGLQFTEGELNVNLVIDPLYQKDHLEEAQALMEKAPKIWAFIQSSALAAKANLPKLYEEYSGQILDLPQELIDELNGYAGLRFFSSSDFQAEHVVDLMQAFIDMEVRRIRAHSYTKVPAFAEIFGNTGMKIQLSLFAFDRDGNFTQDTNQGMDWEEAKRIREKYKNVGTVFVATSDAQARWAMKQDWIDYIIPFHFSGMESKFYEALGWQDFTSTQGETAMYKTKAKVNALDWRMVQEETDGKVTTKYAVTYRNGDEVIAEKTISGDLLKKALGKDAAQQIIKGSDASGSLDKLELEIEGKPEKAAKVRMHELGVGKGISNEQATRKYLELAMKRRIYPVFPALMFKDYEPTKRTGDKAVDSKARAEQTAAAKARWKAMVEAGTIDWDQIDMGYFKLKKDYARTDSAFNPIKAKFNKAKIDEVVQSFIAGNEPKSTPDAEISQQLIDLIEQYKREGKDIGIEMLKAIAEGRLTKRKQGDVLNQTAQQQPTFYSALQRTFETVKQESMPGSQWSSWLKSNAGKLGVKQAEMDWTGIYEFLELKGKDKVSKQEIVEYLKQNGVQVQEVMKGKNDTGFRQPLTPDEQERFYRLINITGGEWDDQSGGYINARDRTSQEEQEYQGLLERHMNAVDDQSSRINSGTKFSEYTLPGGENYRELLLTLPAAEKPPITASDAEKSAWADKAEKEFHSSHWSEPNILAHIRFNSRTDAAGNKVLFIEEIQSDWGQKGKKEGFQTRNPIDSEKHHTAEKKRDEIIAEIRQIEQDNPGIPSRRPREVSQRIEELYRLLGEVNNNLAKNQNKPHLPPQAPFVTDTKAWTSLAIKRMIRYAAENGFDKIAFVNGEQSAERYDLGKRVDVVVVGKNGDGWWYRADKDGEAVLTKEGLSQSDLAENIGKDLADKAARDIPESGGQKGYRDTDLRVGGEGMKSYYDQIVPQVAKDIIKKHGGKMEALEGIDGNNTQAGFTVTPEMRESVMQGQALFQSELGQNRRGGFDPRTMTTILSQQSDLSTFLHESGHFYLEFMSRLAAMPEATEQMKSDMQTILDWFGVADLATWQAMSLEEQRRYHEQWAYNYEIYLSEGKAPSVKLQKIFDRFSQWMRRVYKSIRDDLNEIFRVEHGTDLPVLTGEVRQVMDRMLASEEEIKQAESVRSMAPLFQDKQQSGMDDATWAAYQDMLQEAHDAAVTDLTKASIRQLKWLGNARSRILKALQRESETTRKEVRAEVAEEVRNEPVYRAERFIRKGELDLSPGANRDARRTSIEVGMEGSRKLDSDAVKEMFGEEDDIWRTFREKGKVGIVGPNGLHPDVVAEMVGFDSGHALVIALANSRPINEVIEERTDERMMAEHSEMNDPAVRELAVEQALHNEARARFVAVELRFLSKATAPVKVITEAAKQVARQIISGKKLGDIRPRDYSMAEARAARDAEKAMKKGDSMGAVKKKQDQLLQNHLAAEAVEARQFIEKSIDYLKRIQNDAARKRIGADYADQIQALLYRFGLAGDMPIGDRLTLGQWLDAQEESGFAPDIADYLVDERYTKPAKEMTMAEFEDLVDATKQIYHIGKNQQKLLTSATSAEYKAARDEIVASIEEHAGDRTAKTRTPTTNLGRIEKGLKKFFAAHIKAAMAARTLDGGKDAGPLWEYLIRPANERADMETRMRAEATEALTKILDPVFKQGKMGGKGRYFPSIGRSLNRESVLTIALNCGNVGNRQRLLDGEGWTMEQVMPILETLTSEELAAVQKIWDHFESYRPMIAAKERRVYGKEPKWIAPAAITIKSADGQDVTLAGGYYPVVYDAAANQKAEAFADAEQARRDLRGAFTSATTRRSFTKSRAEKVVDRPLVYTLSGLYNGVNEVIHDLAWHEWLIDANRLLRSKSIDNAIRSHYGDEFKGIFKSWAKDIAGGDRRADNEAALSWIRQGVSAAGLGFNVMSAILQVTGFTGSIVRVGAKWIGRGVYLAGKDLRTASKDVNEKSDFMADRSRTQMRELADLRNRVQDETDIERRIKTGTYLMMMGMQRVVDVPTWLGAYEKAIVEGEHDEETAVALADQAVRDSQGSGLTSDLSAIERGGPAMKLFTVFYSYMNTVFNLGVTSAMTQKSKGKLAADMLLLYVVPVILNKAIKDALTPNDGDDDEWDMGKIARELISEELSYLMGTMVVAREISDIPGIFLHTNKGRSYSGPAGLRNIAELHTFSQQAAQWEFDDAFRKTAINLVGNFTGLPAAQINRTITGAKALQEGKTSNPATLLLGVQ